MAIIKFTKERSLLGVSSFEDNSWMQQVADGYVRLRIRTQLVGNMGLEYPVQLNVYQDVGFWTPSSGAQIDVGVFGPESPYGDGVRAYPNTYPSVEAYEASGGMLWGACLLRHPDGTTELLDIEDGEGVWTPPMVTVESFLPGGREWHLEVPEEMLSPRKDKDGQRFARSYTRKGGAVVTVYEYRLVDSSALPTMWVRRAPRETVTYEPTYVIDRRNHATTRAFRLKISHKGK